MKRQRRQPRGAFRDDLGKRDTAGLVQFAVADGMERGHRSAAQPTAKTRVLEKRPTQRFGHVKHRKVSQLVWRHWRDRHHVVILDDVMSITLCGDFDLKSREPPVYCGENVGMALAANLKNRRAGMLQNMREQPLRPIAELNIADVSP